MALGDGIRRNIAFVEPTERAMFRAAMLELNRRTFPGLRTDPLPGGVSHWFKQDEIHAATHVHNGPEFLPWHREIVNRLEGMLRAVDPRLSLHYWDWTQDPRAIPNANLGNGSRGTLNLFTPDFMGHGGSNRAAIGEPWLAAGFYAPGLAQHRDVTGNYADPPATVERSVSGNPASVGEDNRIIDSADYRAMRLRLETIHNAMHGFVSMGGTHISFRDPFVFLLHSNVDRLFAMWQTRGGHTERLSPARVYIPEGGNPGLNGSIPPWSGIPPSVRPWAPPEREQDNKTYKHTSVVTPPRYDTLPAPAPVLTVPTSLSFGNVPQKDMRVRNLRISNNGTAPLSVVVARSTPPPAGQPLSGFSWTAENTNVQPGGTFEIAVRFSPRAEGSFTTTLRISHNASGGPRTVTLRGRGLPRNVQPF